MYQWLCADLAATSQDFVIAYWHHPPYSKGSHDSDHSGRMEEMRERFVPVLEDYGVDLQLTGHSHSYERSILLDGHYEKSRDYDPVLHAVDSGNGDPEGDGPYLKEDIGPRLPPDQARHCGDRRGIGLTTLHGVRSYQLHPLDVSCPQSLSGIVSPAVSDDDRSHLLRLQSPRRVSRRGID